ILTEIAAIERDELAPYLAILNKLAPPIEVLDEFVPAYTRHLSAPETVILGLEITGEAIRQQTIANLFTDSRNTLIKAMADLLERGVKDGSFNDMPNTVETAYLILQVMEGTAFRHGIERVSIEKLTHNQLSFIHSAVVAR
ncbi:MAG: TetR/AcrR family transcriptional regulator, partial [Pseudomonadota bacterium]